MEEVKATLSWGNVCVKSNPYCLRERATIRNTDSWDLKTYEPHIGKMTACATEQDLMSINLGFNCIFQVKFLNQDWQLFVSVWKICHANFWDTWGLSSSPPHTKIQAWTYSTCGQCSKLMHLQKWFPNCGSGPDFWWVSKDQWKNQITA